MSECTCDARFSGSDDQEWLNRGAPSCTCKPLGDFIVESPRSSVRLPANDGSKILVAGDPTKQPKWVAFDFEKLWTALEWNEGYWRYKKIIKDFVENTLKGE